MTTTSAVPSSDVSDFVFNVQKLDEITTGSALTYVDRLGVTRSTAAGAMARFSALNPRGAWVTATVYQPRDLVLVSGTWYIALDTHTSGATFAGDLTTHWRPEQGVTRADLADDSSAINGDALVVEKRIATNAVAMTLHAAAELKPYYLENFGGLGDNVADDATAFQKAYDWIRTGPGRGKIVLAPGKTYYLNSQITYCDNSVVEGYGAKIRVGTGFAGINNPLFKNFSGTAFSSPGTIIASQNVAFLGIEFDGQSAGVNGATVANADMRGVLICAGGWSANSGVNGLTVSGCNMRSFAGAGVFAFKSSNVRVHGNRFKNFFANTALSIGSCIDVHECSKTSIVDNKIDHDALGLSWHGMVILDWDAGCGDLTVIDNTITNMNGGDGISCEANLGAGTNVTRSVFGLNTIYNCVGQGIGVDGGIDAIIANNTIKSVTGPGILYTGTTAVSITGNTIDGSSLGGITGLSGCKRATIVGNTVRNITYYDANYNGAGIVYKNASLPTDSVVIISSNIIDTTAGPGVYAEDLNAVISGNNIRNAGNSASNTDTLRVGVFAMEQCSVRGNTIKSDANTTKYAIGSSASNFPSISGNTVLGTYTGGSWYYIGYRNNVAHNTTAIIYKAEYDAVLNIFTGYFNGTPSGAWDRGDTMYTFLPSASGFIGSVCTNTTGPVWKTFGAISA
jgi:hypothetical protein